MRKMLKQKMRKAADGGILALIALAIGVIIIIGMYVFTTTFGGKVKSTGDKIGTAMDVNVSKPSATNP